MQLRWQFQPLGQQALRGPSQLQVLQQPPRLELPVQALLVYSPQQAPRQRAPRQSSPPLVQGRVLPQRQVQELLQAQQLARRLAQAQRQVLVQVLVQAQVPPLLPPPPCPFCPSSSSSCLRMAPLLELGLAPQQARVLGFPRASQAQAPLVLPLQALDLLQAL